MASVTYDHVTKRFGDVTAVDDLNIKIADKEFLVLVGPSGCSKSTALRCLARLEDVTDGKIFIGDQVVNDVAPKDRDIAMVFQSYALYPHMSVYDNMAFGLKLRKTPKDEIKRRVNEAAQMLGIQELLDRKPRQLSGGQRQRVAVDRAIVREPKVFLFDEPLSNLDAKQPREPQRHFRPVDEALGQCRRPGGTDCDWRQARGSSIGAAACGRAWGGSRLMCGIAALFAGRAPADMFARIAGMAEAAAHRGPDDEGYVFVRGTGEALRLGGPSTPSGAPAAGLPYCPRTSLPAALPGDTRAALGHRRLAIIDVSPAGHQPMSSADRRHWIVYNGEIYIHVELRRELEAVGHRFLTGSDTEVILAAYREWGRECLHRYNGMFAFVLLDTAQMRVFVARDRFGVKPLYYWRGPGGFLAFASEIKQFSVLPGWRARY